MNIDVSTLMKHGIDYRQALDRFGENAALFERISQKFLDDNHFSNLESALQQENYEQALREAHSLKGIAGNLSFTDLYLAASEINEALRSNNIDALDQLMPPLRTAYTSVIAGLRIMIEE